MSNIATASRLDYPRIALTPGEPAGIGPDLAIALALEEQPAAVIHYADPGLIAQRAELLGARLRIVELEAASAAESSVAGVLQIVPVTSSVRTECGQTDRRNAAYVLACLDRAIADCANGNTTALVTGPVNKAAINNAGIAFSGHTEYLAGRVNAPLPVMMLVAGSLRVALLTTHVPLAQVPALISEDLIVNVVDIVTRETAALFALQAPRICVCGLNPHAGEQGHLGHEERDIITPAINTLRARGLAVSGPMPADTAFTTEQRNKFDVIVAMYHDQGLTALKALSFGDAVNVTLGLPFIRTSVDHGTALDLAGSGRANPDSLRTAIRLAIDLSRSRHGSG
jgi:4-hydroxythreonine-4-phosphate dehydrogenase